MPVPTGTAFVGCCELGLLNPEERKGQKCGAILDKQSEDTLLIMLRYVVANTSTRQDEGRPGTATMHRIPLSAQSSTWQNTRVGIKCNLLISPVKTLLTVSGTFAKEVHTNMDHALQRPA